MKITQDLETNSTLFLTSRKDQMSLSLLEKDMLCGKDDKTHSGEEGGEGGECLGKDEEIRRPSMRHPADGPIISVALQNDVFPQIDSDGSNESQSSSSSPFMTIRRSRLCPLVGDFGATLFSPLDLRQDDVEKEEEDEEEDIDISSIASLDMSEDADEFLNVAEPDCGLDHCPRILSDAMFRQIVDEGLPFRLRFHKWKRIFSISRDGDSFVTMLALCRPYKHTLLVVKTVTGHILGGYVSEYWREQQNAKQLSYYGRGESFLFANHPASVPGFDMGGARNEELSIYKWTGLNDYCQICDTNSKTIAMGGQGGFGLIVKDDFFRGGTNSCSTYNNPPLTQDRDGTFQVACFEIYGLLPYRLSSDSSASPEKRITHSISCEEFLRFS